MAKATKIDEPDPYEAEQRRLRMEQMEVRIARTPGGERFLDRMYEIKRPRPLRGEDDKESA